MANSPEPRLRFGTILLLFLGLLCVLFVGYRLLLAAQIREAFQSIRARGEPTTMAELSAMLPLMPPSGQNAADFYQQALDVFAEPDRDDKAIIVFRYSPSLPPRRQPLSQDEKRAAAEFLNRNTETLRLARQGVHTKQCRHPQLWEGGPMHQAAQVNNLREISKLFVLEAALLAEQGQPEKAVDDIVDGLAYADSLRDDPELIHQFMRWTLRAIDIGVLDRVLSRTALSNEQLLRLTRETQSHDSTDLKRALLGARCVTLSEFDAWTTQSFNIFDTLPLALRRPLNSSLHLLYTFSGAGDMDKLSYLELARNAMEIAMEPVCAKKLHRIDNLLDFQMVLPQWRVLSRYEASNLSGILKKDFREFAANRVLGAVFAVERFRNDKDHLPGRLAELAPAYGEVPLDPYDDQPIRYRRLPPPQQGYVVYSIGEDCKDNGGISKFKSSMTYEPDITFTVER